MTGQGNRHVQKYNQLVEVYDPDGVEKLPRIDDRDPEALATHRKMVERLQEAVAGLDTSDMLSPEERADIADNERLPEPAAVADDQREEMAERLRLIAEALADAQEQQAALETDEFDGFDDPGTL